MQMERLSYNRRTTEREFVKVGEGIRGGSGDEDPSYSRGTLTNL